MLFWLFIIIDAYKTTNRRKPLMAILQLTTEKRTVFALIFLKKKSGKKAKNWLNQSMPMKFVSKILPPFLRKRRPWKRSLRRFILQGSPRTSFRRRCRAYSEKNQRDFLRRRWSACSNGVCQVRSWRGEYLPAGDNRCRCCRECSFTINQAPHI